MNKNTPNLDQILPWGITLSIMFSFLSISICQIFLGLTLILWVALLIKTRQKPKFPLFFWAMLAYVLLSLLACVRSDNPYVSFKDSRELLLFLLVPIIYTGFKTLKQIRWSTYALLGAATASIVFSFGYFLIKAAPGERVAGFMGHYMTQAGLLMLFSALGLSMFLFSRGRFRYVWGIGFGLAAVALILTLTRSAWIGLLIIAVVALLFYKPRTLILVPIALGLFFLVSPPHIKTRALSIFNPKAYSNAQRIEYLSAGLEIIKDYPLTGTGPNTVHVIFQRPKYDLSEEARNNVHLHNNLIQIAAERGIPSLLAWLTFMIWILLSLLKRRNDRERSGLPYVVAAAAGLLALLAAGMFEYNFGDSEVFMLFLYLITLPFARENILKNLPANE